MIHDCRLAAGGASGGVCRRRGSRCRKREGGRDGGGPPCMEQDTVPAPPQQAMVRTFTSAPPACRDCWAASQGAARRAADATSALGVSPARWCVRRQFGSCTHSELYNFSTEYWRESHVRNS